MRVIQICQYLDSNCRSLVSEATALPTESQLLPNSQIVFASEQINDQFPQMLLRNAWKMKDAIPRMEGHKAKNTNFRKWGNIVFK